MMKKENENKDMAVRAREVEFPTPENGLGNSPDSREIP